MVVVVGSRKEKEKDDADGEGGEEGAVTSTALSGGGAGGAAAGAGAGGDKEKDESGKFDDSSAQWFTWCGACRHGGHATHLTVWFKTHVECPVTDCSRVCMSLDQAPAPGLGPNGSCVVTFEFLL